jgi:hypothetical protein
MPRLDFMPIVSLGGSVQKYQTRCCGPSRKWIYSLYAILLFRNNLTGFLRPILLLRTFQNFLYSNLLDFHKLPRPLKKLSRLQRYVTRRKANNTTACAVSKSTTTTIANPARASCYPPRLLHHHTNSWIHRTRLHDRARRGIK